MKKRLFSILLSLAMVVTMMPAMTMTAFAETTHTHNMGESTDSFTKEIKTFTDLQDLFTNGGSGYLANNIECGEALTVAEGQTVDLCLNDKVLDLKKLGNITVATGTTLNLYDCGTGTTHYYSKDESGLWTLKSGGTSEYTTTGGVITGGNASNDCGGVNVDEGSTFNMEGGTIVGNKANASGGAVEVKGGASFKMTGGSIIGNTAGFNGGGVYVTSGSNVTMTGGSIINNTALQGGGVYVTGAGTKFTMTGGEIINNTATSIGGGVYVNVTDTVSLGGTAKITGNTAGSESKTTNNLYLTSNKKVTLGTGIGEGGNDVTAPVTGENGMKIGVTTQTAPVEATPVKITTNGESTDTNYFASDNDAYEVKHSTDHLELAVKTTPSHTHTFTYEANNGKITATCTAGCDKGYDTTPLTLTLTAPASLVYDGNVKAFTFADGEATAWTGAGLELPTIIYQIKQSGQSTYTPLLGTLESVGNYMAQITVGEKTAQVEFAIKEATPTPTPTPAPSSDDLFRLYKASQKVVCDKLITADDSEAVKVLVEETKKSIDDTKYDYTKTLQENKDGIDVIVADLKINIETVRADEATTAAANAAKVVLTKTTTYKNGKIKLTFKRLKLSDGKKITSYQIYRSTSKKFNKNLKKYSIKRTANTKSYTWTNSKKLKKGTKYYYKVRGRVKLSDGTYAYTQWSKVKTAKCKKSR